MTAEAVAPTFGGHAAHVMIGGSRYGLPPRCATRRIHGGKHAELVYVLEPGRHLARADRARRGSDPCPPRERAHAALLPQPREQDSLTDSQKQDSDNSTSKTSRAKAAFESCHPWPANPAEGGIPSPSWPSARGSLARRWTHRQGAAP